MTLRLELDDLMSAESERQRLLKIAHALGHTDPAVWETPGGFFFATCSCGYESTNSARMVDALGKAVHHALSNAKPVDRKAARAGRPLGAVIADERRRGFRVIPGSNSPALATRREQARRIA